ncbi:UPF0262 family protein [Roseiterribacter gracilis]|uniref:UPF0262 protein n=1 Tax=Roseiterribacter gracilis TaxID=2812848 RepID=A0A8S8XBU1_9PROT|nr:UPF0262 protein [Rhodospirillales bacterium TMPK1]
MSEHRIARIVFDEVTLEKRSAEIEHERAVAIYDLQAQNDFRPAGHANGPYALHLGMRENRLVLDIRTESDDPITIIALSLTPFRRVVRDYQIVCESYYTAIQQNLAQVEALDMGRRSLHNEGADLLRARLEGKVECDLDTARRLFTLIYVLIQGSSA